MLGCLKLCVLDGSGYLVGLNLLCLHKHALIFFSHGPVPLNEELSNSTQSHQDVFAVCKAILECSSTDLVDRMSVGSWFFFSM